MTSNALRELLKGRPDETDLRDALDAANQSLVAGGRPRIAQGEDLFVAIGEAADALDALGKPATAPKDDGFKLVHFGPGSPPETPLAVAEVLAPAGAEKLLADLEEATKQGCRAQFIDRNFPALRAIVAAAR